MSDRQPLRYGSIPFRVCLYFACAPDEELTQSDLAIKFADGHFHPHQLKDAVDDGLLERAKRGPKDYVYTAGPLLLRMLGRVPT